MNKVKQFHEIFESSFNDSEEWRRWFFAQVADEPDDIFVGYDGGGRAVTALLMQEYDFVYQGETFPGAYISCVGTRPEARMKGASTHLLAETLAAARERGLAVCSLIPAQRHLYPFYDRLGFAGVYYIDEERYTSPHVFHIGDAQEITPDYEVFSDLESRSGWGVRHSRTQFADIVVEAGIGSGSKTVAVELPDGAKAILLAVYSDKQDAAVEVKWMLADNDAAADAALGILRQKVGERGLTVWRPAISGLRARMRAHGMIRIVDPMALLQAMAEKFPSMVYRIRIRDEQLPENTGIYTISGGQCTYAAETHEKLDLDVPVEVLAEILFSDQTMGGVFGLPTARPSMALMLD